MTTRFALAMALLAIPALPQKDAPPAAAQPAAADSAENTFYRAFYLYRGERRHDEALALYRKFLAAAPDSRYAGRAVNDAAAILTRTGKADEAKKLRDGHAAKKPTDTASPKPTEVAGQKAPSDDTGRDRPGNRARGAAPAASEQAMTDDQKARLKERITELEASLADAEKAGEERTVRRVTRQIENAKRQLESGVMSTGGGDRGNRGQRGNRQRVNFAEMDKDQIAERIEQIEGFQTRMLERLREGGQEEQVKKIEEQWKSMKKLLDEGKKEEAQKVYDEVMGSLRRRRG